MRKILSALILTSLILPALVSGQTLEGTLENIFTGLRDLIVIVAAIAIVFAAYTFVTAGGSVEKVTTARTWLMYALIGVVLAFLAQALASWAKGLVK